MDYDGFIDDLKSKAPTVYDILFAENKSSDTKVFKKTYNDLLNNTKQDFLIHFRSDKNTKDSSIKLEYEITGTSEIAQEIIEEKWNKFSLAIKESGDNLIFTNVSSEFLPILVDLLQVGSGDEIKVSKKSFGVLGSFNSNTNQYLNDIMDLPDDSSITTNTYEELLNDFSTLEKFICSKSLEISDDNFNNYKYIQLENVFNTISSSNSLDEIIVLNKLLFNYQFPNLADLLAEYDKINYTYSNKSIKISLTNKYEQKYEYTLDF
jgi:hypothetical protein